MGSAWDDKPNITKKTRDYHARLRDPDDLGKIHFGMRSFTEGQLEELEYAMFNVIINKNPKGYWGEHEGVRGLRLQNK